MPKFKIGDTAIAIEDYEGEFKKGDEVVVDGFACCPACGQPCIYIKGKSEICNSPCKCGFTEIDVRECYAEVYFEKPISLGETTAYKLSVTIPELTKIKEYQNS